MKKELIDNKEMNVSMGMTREEMNQIVGGTTFTCESTVGSSNGLGNDVCDKECAVCKTSTVTVSICSSGCKSKSKKVFDITD
ncbi:MAG: hypothetical protein J5792_05035 [Bacteroidales bacterium]|nr:hypothetical protein [Bacteroidales bacterium]